MLRRPHHQLLLGASLAVAFGAAACATSDPLMPADPGTGGAQLSPGGGGSPDTAGSTGAAGSMGVAGLTGAAGSMGAAGSPGVVGSTGAAGRNGAAGKNGSGGSTLAGSAGTVGGPGLGGGIGTAGTRGGAGTAGAVGTGAGGAAGGEGDAGIAGYRCTGSTATFTQVYNDIIVKYCAGSACHNPGKSGGVSFKTKSSAYTVFSSLSMPGDVAGSDIYSTIASDPPFMPPRDPTVPADGVSELAAWICAGAQNN